MGMYSFHTLLSEKYFNSCIGNGA